MEDIKNRVTLRGLEERNTFAFQLKSLTRQLSGGVNTRTNVLLSYMSALSGWYTNCIFLIKLGSLFKMTKYRFNFLVWYRL
jgi:hypothetical protein